MSETKTNRVIVRKQVGFNQAGLYEYELRAPKGYRVVNGFTAVAGSETDPQISDVAFSGGYPLIQGDLLGYANSHGLYNAWRFQIKLTAAAPIWFGVICERSDEPDVYLDSVGYESEYTTQGS
jgi:hypothetical protein